MLTLEQILRDVLQILDSYAGPDVRVEQTLSEMQQQIIDKFEQYVH